MNSNNESTEILNIMKKLENEGKVYNNFEEIFQKSKSDGYLIPILKNVTVIFKKEIKYAMSALLKMKEKNENIKINELLETNIYIFKENMKIIISNSIEHIYNLNMQKEKINNLINKKKIKNIEVIKEEEENLEMKSSNKTVSKCYSSYSLSDNSQSFPNSKKNKMISNGRDFENEKNLNSENLSDFEFPDKSNFSLEKLKIPVEEKILLKKKPKTRRKKKINSFYELELKKIKNKKFSHKMSKSGISEHILKNDSFINNSLLKKKNRKKIFSLIKKNQNQIFFSNYKNTKFIKRKKISSKSSLIKQKNIEIDFENEKKRKNKNFSKLLTTKSFEVKDNEDF